ncbi:hypothetical protein K1X41_06630 [Leucobacter luti]|nr:hypothetical protein K1X41_06630 [Leucobacter luti]
MRERGYLSHALSDQNERLWLDELAAEYGTRFVASSGGHSTARTEELFTQLNEQQEAAGADADDAALVSGIGDDEQFAAAAVQVARAMGFDARVVLGVRMGEAGVPGVPACEQSCTGANVAAWIEARGADGVWAPIDVTPRSPLRPLRSTQANACLSTPRCQRNSMRLRAIPNLARALAIRCRRRRLETRSPARGGRLCAGLASASSRWCSLRCWCCSSPW